MIHEQREDNNISNETIESNENLQPENPVPEINKDEIDESQRQDMFPETVNSGTFF